MKIFSRDRVSNITSASVILFTLYAVVFQAVPDSSLTVMVGLSGFASKHLFDSMNQKKEE